MSVEYYASEIRDFHHTACLLKGTVPQRTSPMHMSHSRHWDTQQAASPQQQITRQARGDSYICTGEAPHTLRPPSTQRTHVPTFSKITGVFFLQYNG